MLSSASDLDSNIVILPYQKRIMEEERRITPVNTLGEFGLIEKLTADLINQQPSTIKGVGDDAAVIDSRGKLTLVSTDLLVEGIHFDLMYTPLKHLGYKSVVVNVSDIYAMNASLSKLPFLWPCPPG